MHVLMITCSTFNLFALLCSFYLIYVYCLLNLASLSIVTYPRRYSTGFQSYPVLCLPERGHIRYIFVLFGYIGWKPGRKFRSRIRMDGSAVCTRDTTPRTKMGSKVFIRIFAMLSYCLFDFITVYLNYMILIV